VETIKLRKSRSGKASFEVFGGFMQAEANDDHDDPISTCRTFHLAVFDVLTTCAQVEFMRKSAAEGFVNVDFRRTVKALVKSYRACQPRIP
jgi:hypothetical protein